MELELINFPFNISYIQLNDRYQSVVGVEFTYTGEEPIIHRDEWDYILLKIFDKNKSNPNFAVSFDEPTHNCPIFDDYLHFKEYRIDVYSEYDNNLGFQVYKVKILQQILNKELGSSAICMETPIKFHSNGFDTLWPNYVVKYIFKLTQTLRDTLCPHAN
jgi:hypothetical protein